MTDAYVLEGDCRVSMDFSISRKSVQTCITSPPYFGLRDYNVAGQIGLEATPDLFVTAMVDVFRSVREVLRDDGTVWLNLGDSYNTGTTKPSGASRSAGVDVGGWTTRSGDAAGSRRCNVLSLKTKDLIGMPWRVALALQADGWYLRQDIIWAKPNPMPESVTDRCTKSHEYIFLLSKSERYYFDYEAIKEPVAASTVARLSQNVDAQIGSDRVPGKTNGTMKAVGGRRSKRDSFKRDDSKRAAVIPGQSVGTHRPDREESDYPIETRNKRSVWTVPTRGYKGAHFATFPPDLIRPCVLAGSAPGDLVLDPFAGSGTTGAVSLQHGRNFIGCELNAEYIALAMERIDAARAGL